MQFSRRESTREENAKTLNSSRDENGGTYRSGDGGGGPALCDPESELLLGGRARVMRA